MSSISYYPSGGTSPPVSGAEFWKLLGERLRANGFTFASEHFFVFDEETTAVKPADGHILQIAYLWTKVGHFEEAASLYLRHSDAVLDAYDRGEYVTNMKAKGNHGYVKTADVRAQGVPPADALVAFHEALDVATSQGAIVVGHNLIHFDIPWLRYHLALLGRHLDIPERQIFDTGACFKASLLGMIPQQLEELVVFFRRIFDLTVKGATWNIGAAVTAMGLGDVIPAEFAHNAEIDVVNTWGVLQEMRHRMGM